MSLTVNHSPTKYFFARNRNYVEVETNNYLINTNYGKIATGTFNKLQNAVLNDTITITWGATTRVYTFKAATNIALNEIALMGGLSIKDFILNTATALMTDVTLSAAYDVTADNSLLRLTAKQAGTAYSLTLSTTVTNGSTQTQAGTDDIRAVPRENYKVICTLFGEKLIGGFEKIVEIAKEPFDNKVKFDIKEYLNNYLKYDAPVFGFTLALQCENVIRRFYLKIQEAYGFPQAIIAATVLPGTIMQNATDTNYYHSLKAGFDEITARLMPDNQNNYYSTNKAFLTRQNRVKTISGRQFEFLYFLFPATLPGNACVRVTHYAKNGSVVFTGDGLFTAPITKNDVYAFPINYPGSVFDQGLSYIHRMEVFVKNNTTGAPISEVFTYVKDEEYRMEENFIYFFNSDGGLDTVRFFGVSEHSSDFEFETASRTLTVTLDEIEGSEEVVYTEKINKASVFSGWKPKSDLVYIEELILSRKAFLYGNDFGVGDIKVPIVILTKTLVKHKTKQHLYGYVIEYREAFTSEISQAKYYEL